MILLPVFDEKAAQNQPIDISTPRCDHSKMLLRSCLIQADNMNRGVPLSRWVDGVRRTCHDCNQAEGDNRGKNHRKYASDQNHG